MAQFVERHGRFDLGDLAGCLEGADVVIVTPGLAVLARQDQLVTGLACHQVLEVFLSPSGFSGTWRERPDFDSAMYRCAVERFTSAALSEVSSPQRVPVSRAA